ncbi:hypothetical protein BV378_07585 [Nostoc sp. RF31YmG]|jgi:hypothetical protein|nr:hypothetical protein BV378_07585 [Nostoc sp. RF31YmG]
MSNPVLDLGNSANWEQLYFTSVDAVGANSALFVPIPPITVPILIESHIIALSITSTNAKSSWNFGGLLSQKVALGLTVGGLPDSAAIQKYKLYLNHLTLLILPKLTTNYSVEVAIPKWFKQVSLVLWQYIGTESDTTEDLINQIKNVDLPRIESKIDALGG